MGAGAAVARATPVTLSDSCLTICRASSGCGRLEFAIDTRLRNQADTPCAFLSSRPGEAVKIERAEMGREGPSLASLSLTMEAMPDGGHSLCSLCHGLR